MSNIPKARRILLAALDAEADDWEMRAAIAEAMSHMFRVYTKKRAKSETRKMTPAIGEQIVQYYRLNPDLSVRAMADIFDVGVGRVSEALAGHWQDKQWVKEYRAKTKTAADPEGSDE